MKNRNRISQLTLELYHRGLATNNEHRLAKKALVTDGEVRKRYEALQESDRIIRQLVERELNRLNIPERPAVPPSRKKKAVVGFLLAAIFICALIPVIFYLTNSGSDKDNVLAEETTHETNPPEATGFIEDIPSKEIASPVEPPARKEPDNAGSRNRIAENPRTEPALRTEPESGVSVATVPAPDTGIRLRGGDHDGTPAVPEEPPNINIPPGITFIFDNMFANSGLTFVIIPARITSIGKNAFSGNPLVSVTIGANVSIEDNAIPGNFATVYNASGKTAGTYTRPDAQSEAWEKR